METGPFAYRLWQTYDKNPEEEDAYEYALFSDSQIVGEITETLGPYQVLQGFGETTGLGHATPILYLRTSFPTDLEPPLAPISCMDATDESSYFGGDIADEMSALLSLLLGVRLKAGSMTRTFRRGGDPKGRPWNMMEKVTPQLSPGYRKCVVPNVYRTDHYPARLNDDIDYAETIGSYHLLAPRTAIALARAARLYQDAIWIAESEPALSWLMLVSAIETAANEWIRKDDSSAKLLERHQPLWAERLKREGSDELFKFMAKELKGQFKATDRFLRFSQHFKPGPPPNRPAGSLLMDWEDDKLRHVFLRVYEYRSRALHAGIPFPAAMSVGPLYFGERPMQNLEKLAEIPGGISTSMLGGTWLAEDTPILLNTYEYLVRNSLIAWWRFESASVDNPPRRS